LKLLTVKSAASRLCRSHGRLLKRVCRARDVVFWRKGDKEQRGTVEKWPLAWWPEYEIVGPWD
jgi:hypothetical protein